MESSPQPIGIAVVEHEGCYLVGIRPSTGPLPGRAEFPGGKCLIGESPPACAVRECREETRLRVTAEQELFHCVHEYPHGSVALHFWLCRPLQASSISTEHNGFRWIPAVKLAELKFPEANRPVIGMLNPYSA